MTIEDKYLEKLNNDVQEKLYDLLVIHLFDVTDKITTKKDELVALLDVAIKNLRRNINSYTRLSYYRYIIILCNTILRFRTQRTDIKDLKRELIEAYTHDESKSSDKIPLNYQINELRITYDARYLIFLIGDLIKQNCWDKALYCLITARLIEPDNEKLDDFYAEIKKNIESLSLIMEPNTEEPEDMILALDSNVVISEIFSDVGEYKIKTEKTFDLEKLSKNNKFIITKSVCEEVRKHLEFKLISINMFCKKNDRFNFSDIKDVLGKRFEDIISKYGIENEDAIEEDILEIEQFYVKYLDVLEEILMAKLKGKIISHKLRKLSQRTSLLPETGDICLFAEVKRLNDDSDDSYGILTSDKDFTYFASEIGNYFDIEIY